MTVGPLQVGDVVAVLPALWDSLPEERRAELGGPEAVVVATWRHVAGRCVGRRVRRFVAAFPDGTVSDGVFLDVLDVARTGHVDLPCEGCHVADAELVPWTVRTSARCWACYRAARD